MEQETQLGIDEALRVATRIADALQYAHGRGVIHRDINPGNILLAIGRPTNADFGIAPAVAQAGVD